MADRSDSKSNSPSATRDGALDQSTRRRVVDPKERGRAGTRDDRLDEDLERERLEPGLDAEGTGGAGANPGTAKGGNSNT
jgi:hypothetical protein